MLVTGTIEYKTVGEVPNIEKILFDGIDNKWLKILINGKQLETILKQLPNEKLCPLREDIFNAFRLSPYNQTKVVIIGREPHLSYNNDRPVDHGLAFSSLEDVSPSLQNIYICLKHNKLISSIPTHANLTAWAKQGILLLNQSLTTIAGQPRSHTDLWRNYTSLVLSDLCKYKTMEGVKLTIILWGKHTQNIATSSDIVAHDILTWSHPSPRAQEQASEEQKFRHCNHFSIITQRYGIRWGLSECIYIMTDGCSNKSYAGWAFYVASADYDNTVHFGKTPLSTEGKVTCVRSEGWAIIHAMEFILEKGIKSIIITDSMFYINVITNWMHAWYKIDPNLTVKKLTGDPSERFIKNRDIIVQLYDLYKKINNTTSVKFEHINSHQKAPRNINSAEYFKWYGNFIADKYANQTCNDDNVHFANVVAEIPDEDTEEKIVY